MDWTPSCDAATAGIEGIFAKFDASGDGELNMQEFVTAVYNWGFGTVRHGLSSL